MSCIPLISGYIPVCSVYSAKMVPCLALIAALCGGSIAGVIHTPTHDSTDFARSLHIVQSNDDGWAEANARAFFNRLTAAGHDVVLSAPALDRSGTGALGTLQNISFSSTFRHM
jgi:hypothetical protein